LLEGFFGDAAGGGVNFYYNLRVCVCVCARESDKKQKQQKGAAAGRKTFGFRQHGLRLSMRAAAAVAAMATTIHSSSRWKFK
jgi:hypothetical protein